MDISFEVNDADLAQFTDKLDALEDALDDELHDAMGDITLRVEARAKDYAPWEYGHLSRSIDQEVEALVPDVIEGVVGSNVEYAPIQEIEQPYLRRAFEDERDYIRRRVERGFSTAVQRVS